MLILLFTRVGYRWVKGQTQLKNCAWPWCIEYAYKSMMEIHNSSHKREPQTDPRLLRHVCGAPIVIIKDLVALLGRNALSLIRNRHQSIPII
jgi:hypothetical protein